MMDRSLTAPEISYVLDHLSVFYTGADLADHLVTGDEAGQADAFFIPSSKQPLNEDKLPYIDGIPVLFPVDAADRWYSVENGRVRFHHDLLKSAFFLLSGYQEYYSGEKDVHGRFPWRSSIQFRLGITEKPVVNYYFGILLEAFREFCRARDLSFEKREREPVFFLSHDVDRIAKYTLRNMAYAVLQLLGLKPSQWSFGKRFRNLMYYARGILLFRKDPYWNFNELLALEKQRGIRSTWFFLEKTREDNSRYHFRDARIRGLIESLSGAGHEIAIHGTVESAGDPEALKDQIQRLNSVSAMNVCGIRQHYLKYRIPGTTRIQADAGLDYDSTLGFAEHIGFRNSYACQFRLYDFEHSKPFEIIQIPLNVMDVGLLGYMQVPLEGALPAIRPVLDEVIRFGGVFSLLWHNCNLDEEENPGINHIYRQILEEIGNTGAKAMTGRELIRAGRTGNYGDPG